MAQPHDMIEAISPTSPQELVAMKLAFVRTSARYLESVYFRRLFLSYTLIALLISAVCVFLMLERTGRAAAEEKAQYSNSRLTALKEQLEHTYPGVYKNAFFGKLLSAVDTSQRDPFSVFYEEYGQSMYQIYHLANYLKEIVADHPEAENVTFYFKNTDFMVDKHAFFPLGDRTPGAELIRLLKSDNSWTNRWILRDVDYGLGVRDRLMTYVISFPERAAGKDIQGYLLIDIRADLFHTVMDRFLADSREKLFMYSIPDGYMAGSSNAFAEDRSEVQAGWNRRMNGDVHFLSLQREGEQWAYAAMVPPDISAPASTNMRSTIVWIGLGTIAIGIVLAYFLAFKSYKPVQHLIQRLKERNAGLYPKQQRNELQALDYVMTELHHTIQYLSQKLSGSKLLDLLHGRMTEDEAVEAVPAASAYIAVNVIWRGDKAKETAVLATHKLSLAHLAVENRPGEWSVLYYADDCASLREQILAELHVVLHDAGETASFAAGMGGTARSPGEIAKSFEQAEAALAYTFLFGMNTIMDHDELSERDEMPQIQYEPLENAMRAGDRAAVERFLEQFAIAAGSRSVPLEAVQFCLMQLAMVVSKVVLDVNMKERLFPAALSTQLVRADTWHDSLEAIRTLSIQVTGHIEQHIMRRSQHELASTLTAYIRDHLHEDISLDQLAALTGLSTSYLSRQFRERIGVPFIDYLTNARLDSACELLRHTALSTKDIAEKVGYSNARYFCARFKSKFGVTPMQYRKMPFAESAFSEP
ncbi:helix-turn-helix transcriptional regulator [Paenibacillus ginsengarvi]|uniref:helix-turn-helix transcriptional regulator n=1 Tax=Paenibacillus ginsengarvi TaxID=400777 RepID=UPI001961DDEE|nr:AraC family transcriptional regulator [Paenibacillus ginsengarvi]